MRATIWAVFLIVYMIAAALLKAAGHELGGTATMIIFLIMILTDNFVLKKLKNKK